MNITTTTTPAPEEKESRLPMLIGLWILAACFRILFVPIFNHFRPKYCPKACPKDLRYSSRRRRGRGTYYAETGSFVRPHRCNNIPDPFQPTRPTPIIPTESKVQEYETKTNAKRQIGESKVKEYETNANRQIGETKVQIHTPVINSPGDLRLNENV